MFEAHNKIFVNSVEQGERLQQGFAHAGEHMKAVPGFRQFNMLASQDGSHFIVRVLWESEDHFQNWVKSEAFRKAHSGQGNNGLKAELTGYNVIM